MKCAWNELLSMLPVRYRQEIDSLGRNNLQEIRLRIGQPPSLIVQHKAHALKDAVCADDMQYIINTASRYSPWTAATIASGYITAQGGHRIGICGEAIIRDGVMTGVRNTTSLCIRVARDISGIASRAAALPGNILIIGPPGSGKTTLLRDLIRQLSQKETVSVVDERGELFPAGYQRGINTDVISGANKQDGLEMLIRTMNPHTVAVDEITSALDCDALQKACWCGVRLLATAHAASVNDLKRRIVYRPLIENRIFEHVICLDRDKHWSAERMDP